MGGDLYQFGPQVKTIFVLVLICLVAAGLLVYRGSALRVRLAWAVLAAGSAVAVTVATVSPRTTPTRGNPPNLMPFRTIKHYFDEARWFGGPEQFVVYALGNVALFLPFGFFVYVALRRGVLAAVAAGALLSLAVEVSQLGIYTRSFDVDDLILNTLGAGIGALLGWLADTSWHRYHGRHIGPRASGPSAFLGGR